MAGVRLVVRIAGVGIDRHDRRIVGQQILAGEGFHEPLLDFVFLGAAVAHAFADLFECRRDNGVDAVARREVRLDLLFAPGGFELRHQVRGTDDVLSQAAQQVDGAAVHQRNGEHAVVRRVLHGQVAMLGENRFQLVEQFLPAGILVLLAGQGIEVSGFNLVDQFDRLAFGGNQVEPAPGHHQARGQTEHAVGDGIAMVVVVEKPRVNVAFAQRRLDGSEVHGQTPIVNKSKDLGESAGRSYEESCGDSRPRLSVRAAMLVSDHSKKKPRILFLATAGSVSHAVRSTSRGARPRIFIR